MKRFLVCPKLMLVILFILQSTQPKLQNSVNALEYSVEERIYIVQKSLVREQQQPQHDSSTTNQQQQQHPRNHQEAVGPLQHEHQRHLDNAPDTSHPHNQQHEYLHHHQLSDLQKQQYHNRQDMQQQVYQQQQQQQQQHYHQAPYEVQQQQHQSLANSMQQVLLEAVLTAAHQQQHHQQQQHNQYQYTQFQWKHESSNQGELSQFYYNKIEASSPYQPVVAQDQLAYYHQQHYNSLQQQQQQQHQQLNQDHHHHQQHHQYIHQQHMVFSDDSIQEPHYNDLSVVASVKGESSCDSHHYESSSILMRNNYAIQEPTCKAAPHHANTGQHNNQHHHEGDSSVPNFSRYTNKQSHNSNVESFPLATQNYHYESSLLAAIRHYWREVSGLCLASAVFLNWLFVVIKRRFLWSSGLSRAEHAIETIQQAPSTSTSATATNRSVSKDTSSSVHDSAFEEIACPMSLEDIETSKSSHSQNKTTANNLKQSINISTNIRQRSSTLKGDAKNSTFQPTEPIPIPKNNSNTININKQVNTTNLSSSPVQTSSLSTSLTNSLNNSEYNSRYSSDFDSIQRLGRGGFGVVFEARNKIDDCHYAVKRICLPLEKEARERVMREVRALAKLDHAGIVRYYNAWLETPPDEWLKQHDAQLGINNSKDGLSFPSTDGIYDRNEFDTRGNQLLNYNGDGYGQSGDNLSSLFGLNNAFNNNNNNNKRRGPNGLNRFLRNNSSSPSLDIVFEGSGSIRLESENNTEKTNSNSSLEDNNDVEDDDDGKFTGGFHDKTKRKEKSYKNNYGDINTNSDSEEDSDFIQFESKVNNNSNTIDDITTSGNSLNTNVCDIDYSMASQLSDPFSSSSSGSSGDGAASKDDDKEGVYSRKDNMTKMKPIVANNINNKGTDLRRNALNYQKELRQFNNTSLVENIHVEKVYLYIQMQLCRKDTLKDWLKTNCDNRDKTTIFDLFYQIVDAVEYVHSQDLIHRDLKPSNIFFSLDGTLKIGDFGLCRAKTSTGIGSSLDLQEYVAESDVEKGFEAVHTEQVGTQLYMSPEQLNGLSYNQKVDIFAMGLILLELLVPFRTQMQRVNVLFKARNNLYSDQFKTDHPNEHELVKTLLSRSPQKRPTASEIKQHDLLANAQLSQPVIERIYHRRRTISSNSSTE